MKQYYTQIVVPYHTRFNNTGIGNDNFEITIAGKEPYGILEAMIDQLVDLAAEIREHEPTWTKGDES